MPKRSCVVCRARSDRFADNSAALIRFVAVFEAGSRRLVCDLYGSKPGRGVYVHLEPKCLGEQKAIRSVVGGLQRGIRHTVRNTKQLSEKEETASATSTIEVGGAKNLADLLEAELRVAPEEKHQAGEQGRTGSVIRSARCRALREALDELRKASGKPDGKIPKNGQKGIQRVRL